MQKFPKLKIDMRVIKQSVTSFIAMDICFQIVFQMLKVKM